MTRPDAQPMSAGRFTVEAAVDGNLSLADLRMDPATLAHQAVVAEEGGNPQLAENFLRAAELAIIDDEDVMQLYEALRPHRSTAEELESAAGVARDAGRLPLRRTGRPGRGRLRQAGPVAVTVVVAGVDVGNHTTEIVLARVDGAAPCDQVAHGQAPTRGRKGSADSLEGAAALLRKLEVEAGVVGRRTAAGRAAAGGHRHRAAATPVARRRLPVRSLRAVDASTPAGTGLRRRSTPSAAESRRRRDRRSRNRFRRRRRPTSRWRPGRSRRPWSAGGTSSA